MPTFNEATTFANESGWYIYQLWQDDILTFWGCTLRKLEGGYRREVCNGNGNSAEEAVFDALSNASMMEPDTAITNLREPATVDLLTLIGAKPAVAVTRTRA